MKSLLIILTLTASTFALACPDLSGVFVGQCQETFKDPSNNKKPHLEVKITQTKCESLEIKTKSGLAMNDRYDLKAGLNEIYSTNSGSIYSGGAFGKGGFSGSILYTSNGSVISFFNEYEVIKEGQQDYLLIDQKSRGYQMTCKLGRIK